MDVEALYSALLADAEARGVRLISKDLVWHQRAIAVLLRIVTFGAQNVYVDSYVTTIGRSIYVTPDWARRSAIDRYVTLRHEMVHVYQFERYGVLPMAIAYLLLPLPMIFAWCRMALEREAYEETVRVSHALGGRAATDRLRDHVVRQFTSGSYGWMWPFRRSMERWYDELVRGLEAD